VEQFFGALDREYQVELFLYSNGEYEVLTRVLGMQPKLPPKTVSHRGEYSESPTGVLLKGTRTDRYLLESIDVVKGVGHVTLPIKTFTPLGDATHDVEVVSLSLVAPR
jgi:hypothetical protein